jgi:hypothetical protein
LQSKAIHPDNKTREGINMGIDWERQKVVIACGKGTSSFDEEHYLCLAEIGSSNVVPTDWSICFVGFGWHYQCIQRACDLAKDAEGGMLQPHKRQISAEGYIKQWREALEHPVPLSAVRMRVQLCIDKDVLDSTKVPSYCQTRYAQIMSRYKLENKYLDSSSDKIMEFPNTFEGLEDFYSMLNICRDSKIPAWTKIDYYGCDYREVPKLSEPQRTLL